MRILSYLIITFLFINTSCKTKQAENNKETITTNSTDKEMIPFTKILAGSHSNIQEHKLEVIKDEKTLNNFFAHINSTRRPGLPIPNIDFSENIVIGLFMGAKSSGGYAIIIDHIDNDEQEMVIHYVEKHPSGMATSVLTQPFYMAKTSKTDKNIRFELIKN